MSFVQNVKPIKFKLWLLKNKKTYILIKNNDSPLLKIFSILKNMVNSFSLYNNSRTNIFSNKTHEKSSLESDGINDSLVVYIRNNKFNNIDNESIA